LGRDIYFPDPSLRKSLNSCYCPQGKILLGFL
jgi:hypothetical protein